MSGFASHFSLPLLLKELIEQSARRRLFVTRVAYALLLFVMAAMFVLPMIYGLQSTPTGMLGIGREMFVMLVMLQFLGIYLFLPALTSGVITIEKERNTLALLFLTKLSPWTIIFEKFGSRIVPMLSLLLTSLPLLAFTYSMGGIETFNLACAVWFLMWSVIQVASVAILASAFFRSTVAAFLATYVILFGLGFGLVMFDEIILDRALHDAFANVGTYQMQWLFSTEGRRLGELVQATFFPPALMGMCSSLGGIGRLSQAYLILFLCGMPTLFSAAACLLLARACLVRRAFLAPANPLLNFFKVLDRLFVWANKRFTRGVVLIKESQSLPNLNPVAWRETAKRSLGQFRYLVRILLVLESPVLFVVVLSALEGADSNSGPGPVSVVLALVWIAVTLIVATSSTNLITGERGRQTLDVLLTSPLSSRQIIIQKMSGVRRLTMICAIPLLTCVLFQTWWLEQFQYNLALPENVLRDTGGYRTQFYLWPEYLIGGVLTIFIYLNLIAWLSLWMGIKTSSPTRAIVGSLGTIVAWCVIPMTVLGSLMVYVIDSPDILREWANSGQMLSVLSSPMMLIAVSENGGVHWLHPMPYLAVTINSLIYGSCWFLIRRRVLNRADQYLGRIRATEVASVPRTDAEQIRAALVTPAAEPVTI